MYTSVEKRFCGTQFADWSTNTCATSWVKNTKKHPLGEKSPVRARLAMLAAMLSVSVAYHLVSDQQKLTQSDDVEAAHVSDKAVRKRGSYGEKSDLDLDPSGWKVFASFQFSFCHHTFARCCFYPCLQRSAGLRFQAARCPVVPTQPVLLLVSTRGWNCS